MTRPLIAVVGSADPERSYDPPLRAQEDATRACEEIGRALADRRCRLLVYSSDSQFIEAAVVRGFLEEGQPPPGSIQIRAPFGKAGADFGTGDANGAPFDVRPDTSRDWQVSFYRSLVDVDAVILMGGGRSTFIAGIIALALKIPILPLATFGGEAERVWEALDRIRNDAGADDVAMMARSWGADSAQKNVESLLRQRERREERLREEERALADYRRNSVRSLAVAALLLILGLGIIPLVFATTPSTAGNIAALMATPLLVAPSGAIVRNVLDSGTDWWRTALQGTIAGAIAGLLFILAQLAAAPDLLAGDAARRLLLFLAVVGFIAGMTFDAVFSNLRAQQVVDTSALGGRQ